MKNLLRRIISAALALSLSVTLAVNAYAEEIEKAHKQETISAETIHTKEKSEKPKKLEKTPITKDNLPEVLDFDRVKEQGFVSRLKSEETDMCEIVLENEDGTRGLYVFDSPVKFKNEKGEIVDKSNKVKPHNKNGSPGFRSESNDIEINLPVALQAGISLKDEEVNVSMKPLPSAVSKRTLSTGVQKDEDSVIYENVFDNNTDIVYTFTYDGVKEDIVLEKYNGKNTFDFEVITGGLSLEEEKGALLLKDENGEVKATMGEIVIFSADNKNNTFGKYKITEKQKNASYIITVCVDVAYLTSPDTKYPVTIDPSITSSIHEELCGIQDMQVFKGTDGTNGTGTGDKETSAGLSGVSRVGWTDWGACRTLVKVNESLLENKNIKYPEQVIAASIEIRDLMCQSQSAEIICYQFVGDYWSETETRTWNDLQTTRTGIRADNKTVSSTNGEPHSDGNRSTDTWELWYKFDLTKVVKNWTGSNNSLIKKGLIFKATVENETEANAAYMKTFGSMQGNENYKPYFYLSYSDSYIPVTNIRLSDSSLDLDVGKTHTFYPIVTPGDATNQQFTWSSSNTAVATVSSSGKVTAKAVGTTTITAQSKDNPSAKATCKVTVKLADSDGDGLDDEIEKQLGTNPNNVDTDGDGYNDYYEVNKSKTDPLKSDVLEYSIKKPYIQVLYNNEASYGGSQMWFDRAEYWLSDVLDSDTKLHKYGCGLISGSDVILYLTRNNYIRNNSITNLVCASENGLMLTEDYLAYVKAMALIHFPPLAFMGVNGIKLANELNYHFKECADNNSFKAQWGVEKEKILPSIIEMIQNDIPVPLSIGPTLFSEHKVRLFKNNNEEIKNLSNLSSFRLAQETEGHYVTVTGLIIDNVSNRTMIRLSSWGEKYYMLFSEYIEFMEKYADGGSWFTNIVYIKKS